MNTNFLLLLAKIFALKEVVERARFNKAIYFVKSMDNTVHYLQSKIDVEDDHDRNSPELRSQITIYKNYLYEPSAIVYQDETKVMENTCFFTASTEGKYFIVVGTKGASGTIRVDCKIYSGSHNKPQIISSSDVELQKAENRIRSILEEMKVMIDGYEADVTADERYRNLFTAIWIKAILVVVLRLVASLVSQKVSAKLMKRFFTTNNINTSDKY
ncbi:hypothetical protein ENBRE01_1954 [Enteropsectra breve]|nr:hypothetical protein ENBRE01_1954 [Enteropsectra breve]